MAYSWKNVNAPSLSGVAALGKLGIESGTNAFNNLSDILNKRDERLNTSATNNAMARASAMAQLDPTGTNRQEFLTSLGGRVNQAEAMGAFNTRMGQISDMKAAQQARELGVLNIAAKQAEEDYRPTQQEMNEATHASGLLTDAANIRQSDAAGANSYDQITGRKADRALATKEREDIISAQNILRSSMVTGDDGVIRLDDTLYDKNARANPNIPTETLNIARERMDKRLGIDKLRAAAEKKSDRAFEVALKTYTPKAKPIAIGSNEDRDAQSSFESKVNDVAGADWDMNASSRRNASTDVQKYSGQGVDQGLLWAIASASLVDGMYDPDVFKSRFSQALRDQQAKTKSNEDSLKNYR